MNCFVPYLKKILDMSKFWKQMLNMNILPGLFLMKHIVIMNILTKIKYS